MLNDTIKIEQIKCILILITLGLSLLLTSCGSNQQEINNDISMPFSSLDVLSYDYDEITEELTTLGFSRFYFIPLGDLESEDMDGKLNEIIINGESKFEREAVFPKDSIIEIKYHSVAEEEFPCTSDECKGLPYHEIMNMLKYTKFNNVIYELVDDADMNNKVDMEIEYVSVGGSKVFSSGEKFPVNIPITVYYSKSQNIVIPCSASDLEGQPCESVMTLLNDYKFENVNCIPLKILHNSEKIGVVERIAINGVDDFKADSEWSRTANVEIEYLSLAEERFPEISKGYGGKALKDIKKVFSTMKFNNVEYKLVEDIDKDNKNEFEIEYISVDGNRNFDTGEMYPVNAAITVYYSERLNDVTLLLDCNASWIFNTYDIEIKLDGDDIGYLDHGEEKSIELKLSDGKYTIDFDAYNETASGSVDIEVSENGKHKIELSCFRSEIEVKYFPEIKTPYDNGDLGIQKLKKIRTEYEDAGYINIQKIPLTDLSEKDLEKKYIVKKIEINGVSDFSADDKFFSDAEVRIYYHSPEEIEVPDRSSKLENRNYKDAMNLLKEAGFTNVKSKKYTGKYGTKARDKMVSTVEIAGDNWFTSTDRFPLDSKITVWYYQIDYTPYNTSTLINELKSNSYNAKGNHSGEYVEVTGVVGQIDSDGKYILLYPSIYDFVYSVQCDIDDEENAEVLRTIKKGDIIKVKGKVTLVDEFFSYCMDVHSISK